MARIRSIKPEYWNSPGHKQCRDPYARLLFIAMWNWADDYGRGEANPRALAGFAFPHDEEISSADIRRMLAEVRRAFGVVFYEVGGRAYYAIPTWEDHQKVDKRSARKNPPPEEGLEWNPDPTDTSWATRDQQQRSSRRDLPELSAESAETPPSGRRDLGAGTEEQRNRGTNTSPPASPAEALTGDGLFDAEAAGVSGRQGARRRAPKKPPPDEDPKWREFWYDAFPRREGRIPALGAWVKATTVNHVDPDVIIAGARAYAQRMREAGTPTEKIKMAQGWLNDQRWEDERPPPPPAPNDRIPPGEQCPVHRGKRANGPEGCLQCKKDREIDEAERIAAA